jgi:hypothetical protein
MGMKTTSPTKLMARVQNAVEVLLPLLSDLRAELGTDRANTLVYASLRRSNKEWIESLAPSEVDDPLEVWRQTSEALEAFFHGDVAFETIRDNGEALDLDVFSCRYADFFRSIGEPELGAILTCELDNHIADLGRSAVTLSRKDTLMQGAKACSFRYQFDNS